MGELSPTGELMAMPAPKLAADAGVAASNANSKGSASARSRRMPVVRRPRKLDGDLRAEEGARVPLYAPYADFFQYQAGPGRLADRA